MFLPSRLEDLGKKMGGQKYQGSLSSIHEGTFHFLFFTANER
jgi:hypothetical protein